MLRRGWLIWALCMVAGGCGSGNNGENNGATPDSGLADVGSDAGAGDTGQPDATDATSAPDAAPVDEAECVDTSQCIDPSAPICRSGACEACQTDTQCQTAGLGESCRPDGRCVACERDDDCPVTAPFCDSEGTCVRCVDGSDCPSLAPACVAGSCESCTAVDTCTDDDWAREVVGRVCANATLGEGRFAGSEFEALFQALQAVTCADSDTLTSPLTSIFIGVSEGRLTLDSAALADGAPLGDLFLPAVADGDACFLDVECLSGLCDLQSTCPGTCRALPAVDEACATLGRPCRADLVCLAGLCEERPQLGQACEGQCDDGLFCDLGTCVDRGGVDAPCSGSGSECEADLYCDTATNKCTAYPDPGETCYGGQVCREGVRCFKGICHDPLPVGSECDATQQCAPGLRCVATRCEQILLPGEECTVSSHCALGLGCIDGRCRSLPDVGEPCFEEGGCLRGDCNETSGLCEARAVGAACSNDFDYDVFDACGTTASCRPDGLGSSVCLADGGVGAACDTFDPGCMPRTTSCNNSNICEAECVPEAP